MLGTPNARSLRNGAARPAHGLAASVAGAEAARRATRTTTAERTTCRRDHGFLRTWTEHAVASSPAAGGSALLLGTGKHHGNDDDQGPLRRRGGSVVVGVNAHRSCVRDALTARRLRRMVKRSSGPSRGDRGNREDEGFPDGGSRAGKSGAEGAGRMAHRASLADALPGNWLPASSYPPPPTPCSAAIAALSLGAEREGDDDAQERDRRRVAAFSLRAKSPPLPRLLLGSFVRPLVCASLLFAHAKNENEREVYTMCPRLRRSLSARLS